MKTAVEWLIGRFHYEGFIGTYCSEEQIKSKRQIMIEIIEQAKEMEKEQIEIAFFKGDLFAEDYFDADNPTKDVGENYYNETYKNTKQ
jgi:predicted secreted protein